MSVKSEYQNSDMDDAYAADPEPTLYTKEKKYEIKIDEISDEGAEDKHIE